MKIMADTTIAAPEAAVYEQPEALTLDEIGGSGAALVLELFDELDVDFARAEALLNGGRARLTAVPVIDRMAVTNGTLTIDRHVIAGRGKRTRTIVQKDPETEAEGIYVATEYVIDRRGDAVQQRVTRFTADGKCLQSAAAAQRVSRDISIATGNVLMLLNQLQRGGSEYTWEERKRFQNSVKVAKLRNK